MAPADINGVELGMDTLSKLADGTDAKAKLGAFVDQYRQWIDGQRQKAPKSPEKRKETAELLLQRADVAARRIAARYRTAGRSAVSGSVPHR